MDSRLKVKIVRNAKVPTYPFTDYFRGFETIDAVRRLFGDKTEEVLGNLRIEFNSGRGYMGVNDRDGHLRVNANYLNTGDLTDIYLDVIHELVHVRQFMDGKTLFDRTVRYVDRPTEIEAYQYAATEARSLGLSDAEILEYLRTDRRSDEDLCRLAHALNLKVEKPSV